MIRRHGRAWSPAAQPLYGLLPNTKGRRDQARTA